MNKGLKITALVFGVLLCAGLIIGGIGFALGGMNTVQLTHDGIKVFNKTDMNERATIEETFPEATSLKVNVGAIREVKIVREGDVFSVSGYVSNLFGGVTAEMNGRVLNVTSGERNGLWGLGTIGVNFGEWSIGKDTYLTITIPESVKLDELDIDVDACDLTVDGISASKAKLDADASEVDIYNVEFDTFKLDANASDCELESGLVDDFEADIDAGSLDVSGYKVKNSTSIKGDASEISLAGSFLGRNTVNINAGEFDLLSEIPQSAITFILKGDVSEITIGGATISTFGDKKTIQAASSEQSVFDIDADLSEIDIEFE